MAEQDAQTAASAENNSPFSDLGLSVGTSLTIETASPQRKYPVQLMGYAEGKSILITPPTNNGKEVLLDKDTILNVRMLVGKQVSAFETKVIYRSIQPFSYYHLSYPESVATMQVRNSERIDVSLECFVTSDFNIFDDWPKKAVINNLSKSGVRLVSHEPLGSKGHELVLAFKLHVSDLEKTLSLRALIRNIEKDETDPIELKYVYGMQFVDMDDNDTLSLASYIYENDK